MTDTKISTIDAQARHRLNIEIKLHINQRLFDKGHITEDVYEKAKELINKS